MVCYSSEEATWASCTSLVAEVRRKGSPSRQSCWIWATVLLPLKPTESVALSRGGIRVASKDGCGRLLQAASCKPPTVCCRCFGFVCPKATERFDTEQLIIMVPAEAILAEGVITSNYQAQLQPV